MLHHACLSSAFLCTAVLLMPSFAAKAATEAEKEPPLSAKWIWSGEQDVKAYNQTIVAKKAFELGEPRKATLRITADSFYRVFVNGVWVNDGPCRTWPEHFRYDVIDVTPQLRAGENEIKVLARYYGVGDFHRVPKQAGLLAQLDVTQADGKTTTIATDASWDIATERGLIVNTPKSCVQMEPAELYDAQLAEPLAFSKAKELFAADKGPWGDLQPRDVALLTKKPVALKNYLGAKVVKCDALNFCLPAVRLTNPGAIEANQRTSCACGMLTIIDAKSDCTAEFQLEYMKIAVDGEQKPDNRFPLKAGRHYVLALTDGNFHHIKERTVRLLPPNGFTLENPLDAKDSNPWCLIRFPEFAYVGTDMIWPSFGAEDVPANSVLAGYQALSKELLENIAKDPKPLMARLGDRVTKMPADEMFVRDVAWQFRLRSVVGDAAALVDAPTALLQDDASVTTVQPSPDGDVELLYDLGEQDIGYYAFDITADAGVCVDIFGVEYIKPDGRVQHTGEYRNGMRYITKQGENRYTSLKRRSQRYVFLTLRNQHSPVKIRNVHLVESTYPVNPIGNFACSDPKLDKIWEISTRTLKLCMEDTYTDCPLYEQTHWVGDARNESLFGYSVFGATDIASRCIRLTGQSLERYPMVGCQTPSCWNCILPAWSFLWGISTWDYYWATGDQEALRESWPWVIQNLQGAEKFVNQEGLFAGPLWNLFDWANIDQSPKAVLHNSMFMVGAIDAALKSGEALGDTSHADWLKKLRQRLVVGINKRWDAEKRAYPDSIHDDGAVSPSTCQHTSFLSVLYDIIEPANIEHAKTNLLNPPEKMVKVGSPFAMLYMDEALEKLGLEDEIVRGIYRDYVPMLDSGATTVWESFPTGSIEVDGFPTRSHCHAWSSAPSYYLPRIILGIKATSPASKAVELSPRLSGLTWARGTIATVQGPIQVEWKLSGDKLDVTCQSPAGVQVKFVRNDSLAGKQITLNGKPVE